jgi:hypothetical protein
VATITQINKARIMMKYNTEEYWLNHDFIPFYGELVIYNIGTKNKIKVGDGKHPLSQLDFVIDLDEKLSLDSKNAISNNAVTQGLQDLLEFVNTHYGELADALTDKMTPEGLQGDLKTEIPTAKAVNDYVQDALANSSQIQIITWDPED